MLFNLREIKEAVDWATGDDGFRSNEVVEILKQMKEEKDMQPPKVISKLKVEMIMKDLLKLIDKVEDLEQIVINQGAKQRDNYKLVNDRVDEAFDVIKMLERKV